MGGIGSGHRWRYDTRETVEQCLALDINTLVRDGLFEWDCVAAPRSLVWRRMADGDKVASIRYALNTRDSERAWARLTYTKDGSEKMDYTVPLTYTLPPYGGRRMWFRCPLSGCGRRVAKLYLPAGGKYFGCRHCYDLAYLSQNESPHERYLTKAQDIHMALGGDGNMYDGWIPPKPKHMRWKRYNRMVADMLGFNHRSDIMIMDRFAQMTGD